MILAVIFNMGIPADADRHQHQNSLFQGQQPKNSINNKNMSAKFTTKTALFIIDVQHKKTEGDLYEVLSIGYV